MALFERLDLALEIGDSCKLEKMIINENGLFQLYKNEMVEDFKKIMNKLNKSKISKSTLRRYLSHVHPETNKTILQTVFLQEQQVELLEWLSNVAIDHINSQNIMVDICQGGYTVAFDVLVNHPKIDLQSHDLVMLAVKNEQARILLAMTDHPSLFDFKRRDDLHMTALDVCVVLDNRVMVKMLAGLSTKDDVKSAMILACQLGRMRALEVLIPKKLPSARVLLFQACIHGHVEVVRFLLKVSRPSEELFFTPDGQNESILDYCLSAETKSGLGCADVILKATCDGPLARQMLLHKDDRGRNILHDVVIGRNHPMVLFLVDWAKRLDILTQINCDDAQNTTPFFYALTSGDIDIALLFCSERVTLADMLDSKLDIAEELTPDVAQILIERRLISDDKLVHYCQTMPKLTWKAVALKSLYSINNTPKKNHREDDQEESHPHKKRKACSPVRAIVIENNK